MSLIPLLIATLAIAVGATPVPSPEETEWTIEQIGDHHEFGKPKFSLTSVEEGLIEDLSNILGGGGINLVNNIDSNVEQRNIEFNSPPPVGGGGVHITSEEVDFTFKNIDSNWPFPSSSEYNPNSLTVNRVGETGTKRKDDGRKPYIVSGLDTESYNSPQLTSNDVVYSRPHSYPSPTPTIWNQLTGMFEDFSLRRMREIMFPFYDNMSNFVDRLVPARYEHGYSNTPNEYNSHPKLTVNYPTPARVPYNNIPTREKEQHNPHFAEASRGAPSYKKSDRPKSYDNSRKNSMEYSSKYPFSYVNTEFGALKDEDNLDSVEFVPNTAVQPSLKRPKKSVGKTKDFALAYNAVSKGTKDIVRNANYQGQMVDWFPMIVTISSARKENSVTDRPTPVEASLEKWWGENEYVFKIRDQVSKRNDPAKSIDYRTDHKSYVFENDGSVIYDTPKMTTFGGDTLTTIKNSNEIESVFYQMHVADNDYEKYFKAGMNMY